MPTSAIVLILISALMHAMWNLMGKHAIPNLAYFFLANTIGGLVVVLPLALFQYDLWQFVDSRTLWLGSVTGLFLGSYYWSLAQAYRAGQLSIVYPLVRSLPVLLVSLVVLAQGDLGLVNLSFIAGAALIIGGSIILPLGSLADFKLENYINRAFWYVFIAAVSTAGYSLIDARAIEGLKYLIDRPRQIVGVTIVYAFIELAFASLWMALVLLYNQRSRESVIIAWQRHLKSFVFAGIFIHATYTLVLISMSMVDNVAYVVAFRQISIPIGVLLGIYLLREKAGWPRYLGATAMFAGVVLVSI